MATEETALLPKTARTPLPKLQLSIILLTQICEPITSQSIYPYINQLVSELDITGGDEKKVGYYAGLESLFFLTEAMTVLQWSRASDYVGRKPILLIGLFGMSLSIFCFGLSRTFWTLVLSRCLCGLLSGNVGVMKSVMADMTDRTNRAQGYAFVPIVWAVGASIGPLIGGTAARPADRFPQIFTGAFWKQFPYFLPCLITGSLVCICFFILLAFFKETNPPRNYKSAGAREAGDENNSDSTVAAPRGGPLPMREILVWPVVLSVSNYVMLAFLNTTYLALFPLFAAMPIEIGGLGLPPPTIGILISVYGFTTGCVQLFLFAPLVHRYGEKRVFIAGLTTALPIYGLFPIMSESAKQSGLSSGLWALVGCSLAGCALMDLCFGAIFMFVTASVPKSSRGTANGLAQTSASLARAIGPVMGTSMFSFSVQYNLLGGYFVYVVFMTISALALVLASQLPEEVWEERDD